MDDEEVSPAFIGNYQAYVMERLNEFTITPPFLPSICQISTNDVIELFPRPTVTNAVTVDNADTGAVDDNAETEAIGGNADTGAIGGDNAEMGAVYDITETGAVETEAVGLVAVDNDNTDDLIIEEFIEESPPDVTGLVKMHH
eukprot:scaffold184317_cov31-Cyclotella_meneghiniana.AAC.1